MANLPGFLIVTYYSMDPRSHPFYHGDDNKNVALLEEILMTYVMYNFDLGYVQVKHCVLCNICAGGGDHNYS